MLWRANSLVLCLWHVEFYCVDFKGRFSYVSLGTSAAVWQIKPSRVHLIIPLPVPHFISGFSCNFRLYFKSVSVSCLILPREVICHGYRFACLFTTLNLAHTKSTSIHHGKRSNNITLFYVLIQILIYRNKTFDIQGHFQWVLSVIRILNLILYFCYKKTNPKGIDNILSFVNSGT